MNRRSIIMPVFTASRSLGDNKTLTMRVTLPAEPWGDNPPNTEPERLAPPIRSDFDWRKDSVLRHAARVG